MSMLKVKTLNCSIRGYYIILRKTIILVCLVSAYSCVKEIPFPKNNNELPYVLVSFIKGGEKIKGSFYNVSPIDKSPTEQLTYYKVRLSWDSLKMEILSLSNEFEFTEIARPGKKYSMQIFVGDDTLSAEAVVPFEPHILKAGYKIGSLRSDYNEPVLETNVSVLNDPNSAIEIKYFYGNLEQKGNDPDEFSMLNLMAVTNSYLLSEGYIDFNPFTFVINSSDSLLNINLNYVCGSYEYNGIQYVPASAFAVVRSISPAYYQFVKSMIKHNYNQGSTASSGTSEWDYYSFFKKGEPVELFSNVKGGVGIVAGYSETLKTFEIQE